MGRKFSKKYDVLELATSYILKLYAIAIDNALRKYIALNEIKRWAPGPLTKCQVDIYSECMSIAIAITFNERPSSKNYIPLIKWYITSLGMNHISSIKRPAVYFFCSLIYQAFIGDRS